MIFWPNSRTTALSQKRITGVLFLCEKVDAVDPSLRKSSDSASNSRSMQFHNKVDLSRRRVVVNINLEDEKKL